MATEQDVGLLEDFLDETLDTYGLVIEFGDIRVRERDVLRMAIREIEERQPQLIVAAYREIPEVELVAAGVVGQQLAAKVEIPRIFVELLRSETRRGFASAETGDTGRAHGPRTGNVRRWIKRTRVLVGTLADLFPPAEALGEILDLLDGALDRPG